MIADSLKIPKTVAVRILKEDLGKRNLYVRIFLLHDNAPAHKDANICQFLTPKKCYNPLSPRTLQIYLRQNLKMKLKGFHFADVADIQEVVTDDLKNVHKEEFTQLLRNCMTALKPVYTPMEFILNKKVMCLPHVSSIFYKYQS
jgi:hypothetical protein